MERAVVSDKIAADILLEAYYGRKRYFGRRTPQIRFR